MPLDITKPPNKKPISSGHHKNSRPQDKSIADRVKHRKLLAKQAFVSEKTGLESTAANRKRVEDAKRKSVKAAAEEEDDSESEHPEEDTVATVGRGRFGLSRPLNKDSGCYPAIFVRREGETTLLKRLSWEEAALHNPRDLVWIKHSSESKSNIPVNPTLPTYKDYSLIRKDPTTTLE